MKTRPIMTKSMWESAESLLPDLYPIVSKSAEAITDAMNETPPGGSNPSDAPDGTGDSNEQNNDFNSGTDTSGMDSGLSSGDSGGMNDMSGSGGSDMSGGMDSGMGYGSGGNSTQEININPDENPFKAENGKQLLDSMLEKLKDGIEDVLKQVHSNADVDAVVVSDLEDLNENVDHIRDTVFVLPKETTMVRYKACVKTFELLCKALCKQILDENHQS